MGMTDPSPLDPLDPTDEELVAAYAIDALDPDEAAQAEALLATSRLAASLEARMRLAAAELAAANFDAGRADTSSGDAPDDSGPATPSGDLRARTLDAALTQRSPAPITPTDAVVVHRIELQRLLTTLDGLSPMDWRHPVDPVELAGFSVHDLAAHIAGSEAMFAQLIGRPTPGIPETSTDNEGRAAEVIARHRTLTPGQTIAELESLAAIVDSYVSMLGADALTRPIEWWGTEMPIADVLLHRAFEVWIHHDDIRRASDIAQAAPPPGSLGTMSTKACSWTPLFLSTVDATIDGGVASIVLTGPGGGTHLVPLGFDQPASDAEPRFELTMGVVEYCRAIGNRVPPEGLHFTATGDTDLADRLVHALTNLAGL